MGWLQRAADEARRMGSVGAVSWMEMRCYMASTLLRDTDSVSMARSLEVRVPLLDTPLVEFVCALPNEARRAGTRPKALLCGCAAGRAASRDSWTEKTDIHAAVGTVAARAVAAETGRKLRGDCDAAERPLKSGGVQAVLAVISCGQDDVVEAVVDFCFE